MTDKELCEKITNASYELATLMEQLAVEKCKSNDVNAIHFIVAETRKIVNMPRILKLRVIRG